MKTIIRNLSVLLVSTHLWSQEPAYFNNPILPGFNPDPTICRVGEDYYLVTSSFTWYPGLPIYHSKDLVNWQLIGHGIERADQVKMIGIEDKNGIWAPTIRYHDGIFYIVTTCNTCGGNFYITAKNPAGPWSDPVWLPNAPGIDPSFFWDDDGKCYYIGNRWDSKTNNRWPGQTSIWIQEFDIKRNRFIGEQKHLTFGYASNARYAEGPHIYKVNGKYLLIIGEGGTDENHSVTVHHSNSIFGPYIADQINPVMTHRHLGSLADIQAVGHADLLQTQNGDWWAVLLGKRMVQGKVPLGRETFLCKIDFQGNTPIFNKGAGRVLLRQLRPSLPWSPTDTSKYLRKVPHKQWYTIRTQQHSFYKMEGDKIALSVIPNSLDSLDPVSMLLQKVTDHRFTASVRVSFSKQSKKDVLAGLVLYRTTNSYFLLVMESNYLVLYKKFKNSKDLIAKIPYKKADIYFKMVVDDLNINFFYGDSEDNLFNIGQSQTIIDLADNTVNRFNGLGVGLYAGGNATDEGDKVFFEKFKYQSF